MRVRKAMCVVMADQGEELRIDLGPGSGTVAEGQSGGMTWLQAAEHVLREHGGPGMHIRDLTRTILELGIVRSSCSTSLETLLYRQTSKPMSKFIRVPGQMGCFGLRQSSGIAGQGEEEEDMEDSTQQITDNKATGVGAAVASGVGRSPLVVPGQGVTVPLMSGGRGVRGGEAEESCNFNPKVVYKRKKREGGASSMCSGSGSEDSGWSSSSDEESEALYHKRYVFAKRMAKGIIYENVAMAEQLKVIEDKIATAQAERQFLLDKFMKFSQRGKPSPQLSSSKTRSRVEVTGSSTATAKSVFKTSVSTSFGVGGVSSVSRSSRGPPPLVPLASLTTSQQEQGVGVVGSGGGHTSTLSALLTRERGGGGERIQEVGGAGGGGGKGMKTGSINVHSGSSEGGRQKSPGVQVTPGSPHSSSGTSVSSESEAEPTPAPPPPPPPPPPSTTGTTESDGKMKGSRRKTGKVRRLHPIPLNDDGSPVLPIHIGGLTVHNLGKIVYDKVAYHTERYLLPVGFHGSRTYPSMLDPDRRTTYHCTILDGGDVPLFEMRAEDSEEPVQATSSTACQSIVLRAINKARDRQATNSGSGPEFFGYSNPTILNILQKLPNSGRCSKYKFIKFDSPSGKTGGGGGGGGGGGTGASKSRTKRKNVGKGQAKGEKEKSQSKKMRFSVSPVPPMHSVTGGKVGVVRKGGGTPTDPSLAPVLGPGLGQLGMESGMALYSSSDEWSSSDSGHELTVDM